MSGFLKALQQLDWINKRTFGPSNNTLKKNRCCVYTLKLTYFSDTPNFSFAKGSLESTHSSFLYWEVKDPVYMNIGTRAILHRFP